MIETDRPLRLAEMPVTDSWSARIRVTIDLPHNANSLSYAYAFDTAVLYDLTNIHRPDANLPSHVFWLELEEYKKRKEKQSKLIDYISHAISMSLVTALEKESK